MKYWSVWSMAAALCFAASSAHAQDTVTYTPLQRAVKEYDEGRFASAAILARQTATADGFAFAAQAELAEADVKAEPNARADIVDRAEADARRALDLDPFLAEAHLQLAIALGFKGRLEGEMFAHLEGYATEARSHLDFVMEREPDNPWAHALLGGWHLEIAGLGGILGRALYGASADAGVDAYDHALELKPGEPVISYQYAMQLASLETEIYRKKALAVLAEANGNTSSRFLDAVITQRIEDLVEALRMNDGKKISLLIERQTWRRTQEPAASTPRRHEIRPPIGLPR